MRGGREFPRSVAAVGVILALLGLFAPVSFASSPRCPYPASSLPVAVVEPTFTAAPYALYPGLGFYGFYRLHAGASVVTQNLSMLEINVASALKDSAYGGWGIQDAPLAALTSGGDLQYYTGCQVSFTVVSDPNVDAGALFHGGTRSFGAVVIGHEEYVTASEFAQFQKFVQTGGRLIEASGNNFYAEVNYTNGVETFWRGHGWEFDDNVARASQIQPFEASMRDWFGSYYAGKISVPEGGTVNPSNPIGASLSSLFGGEVNSSIQASVPQEANAVDNFTGTSLITSWDPGESIYSYVHAYGSGYVVATGLYSEDSYSFTMGGPLTYMVGAAIFLPHLTPERGTTISPTEFPWLVTRCERLLNWLWGLFP